MRFRIRHAHSRRTVAYSVYHLCTMDPLLIFLHNISHFLARLCGVYTHMINWYSSPPSPTLISRSSFTSQNLIFLRIHIRTQTLIVRYRYSTSISTLPIFTYRGSWHGREGTWLAFGRASAVCSNETYIKQKDAPSNHYYAQRTTLVY